MVEESRIYPKLQQSRHGSVTKSEESVARARAGIVRQGLPKG